MTLTDGRRSIERKKKSWMRNIKNWTKKDGGTLIHVAHNRNGFAVIVATILLIFV